MSRTRQALGHTPQEFEYYDQPVSLAFFPDGKRVVHVSKSGLATLLQVQDRRRVGSWRMAACVATVSEDGKWIVCGCSDGKLRLVDAESQTLTIETNDRHSSKVTALDVSTDSSTVASGSSNGSVIVWSVTTGERLAGPLDLGDKGKISFIRFTRCGNRLAGCTNTVNPPNQHGAVYILDIHDNQLTQRVVPVVTFNSCVTAISWSDDVNGQQRILAGLERSLAVIDPSHGESDPRKPIPSFRTLSRNGKFIVSGTWQDGVRFWDAATFAEIGPNLPSCPPLAISPNNTLVNLSRNAGRCSLSIWNLSDILPKRYTVSDDEIPPSPSLPTDMAIHSDSQVLGFEAIEVFNTMLSEIQLSLSPEVHRQYQLYASPSQRRVAESIISVVLAQRPPVLIDTRTGHLCHGPLRILTLEVDPTYRDLLSSIGERGQDVFRQGVETFFEYVMFSHKWDDTCEEPSFHDILGKSVYNDLDQSPTNDKLRGFCQTVRETGHRWAWSDTCCVNRADPTVLNRAIVSMYRWYKGSALTLALLAGIVPPSKLGNLRDSIWMTRAWTLQELLAPRVIRFYDSEWNPYLNDPNHNHRDSPAINKELASAVSVTSKTLSAFHPANLGVREKLRLASTRTAKYEEDIAYSLFGIFASDLQPNYGEGKGALGRLLEEIVHRSGDVTVLAWTGCSSQFNSCLPAEIAVYEEPPQTVFEPSSNANKLRTRAVELRSLLPREAAVAIYGRITNLPKASFVNRRLHLPCIVFAVERLTLATDGPQWRVYRASVSMLRDVSIRTVDKFPHQEPRGLLLVHPWIRNLLDPPASPASDDYTRALWLIARLGLKFNALLLQQQPHHGYKRVAADHEIAVQLPRLPSLQDIRTEVLDVWDCYTSVL